MSSLHSRTNSFRQKNARRKRKRSLLRNGFHRHLQVRPKPRDGSDVRMSLSWADFISLVAKHKSDAFQLDAEIDLADLELLGGNPDAENHEITRDIANKIWKTNAASKYIIKQQALYRTSLFFQAILSPACAFL